MCSIIDIIRKYYQDATAHVRICCFLFYMIANRKSSGFGPLDRQNKPLEDINMSAFNNFMD